MWQSRARTNPELPALPAPVIRFEFPIGWSYLSKPVPAPARAKATAKAGEQWEMVVPKMGRPAPARLPAPPANAPAISGAAPGRPHEGATPIFYRPRLYSFPHLQPRIPPAAIVTAAVAIVALLSGGIYFLNAPRAAPPTFVETAPRLAAASGDWIADYSVLPLDGGGTRHVSVIRQSVNLTDFRLQFRGTIQSKALACAFRVRDPDNFYAMKIEFVRPDATPVVALTRFAVINGIAGEPAQIPLPMQTYLDTIFRVRLEAEGSHFTAWVQDQKVDEWTDPRLLAGGVGISSERNEQWTLLGEMNVFPMLHRRPVQR